MKKSILLFIALIASLTIFAQTPVANAGADTVFCGYSGTLNAIPSIGTGLWTTTEPDHVMISEPNNPNTEIISNFEYTGGLHFIVFELIWTETNGAETDIDIVQIEFLEIPVVSAGENQDVCGTCTTLEGVSGGHIGSWLINGSAYDDYSDPQTYVCQSSYGPVTYTWLELNHAATMPTFSCASHDEVVITYYRIPTASILTSEADSTICGLTFTRLRAESTGSGITGYWYTNNPGVIFGDEFSNNTSVTVPNYGYYDFYWIVETGPAYEPGFCTDTAGPLTIHFIEMPVANAGGDTLFCGYSGNLDAIPSVGTGVWSTPSVTNISFATQNDPNTLITSNIINPGNPYFNLIWTEDNTNGCTDRDTIRVIFARIPNSNIDIIPPKCFGEPATIAAVEDSLQQYTWNFYNGTIDSTSINPLNGQWENFVHWNSTDTLHRISLIATNYWGCQSAITIDTVYEPAIPTFDVTIISDTCMLGKGGIIFGDTLGNNAFFWLDTVNGPAFNSPIRTVYNLPTGEYGVRTSCQTPNMTHYAYYLSTFGTANCVDTLNLTVPYVGIIKAQIEVSVVVNLNNLTTENANVIFLNLTEFEETETYICEWNFDDGDILANCETMIEHTYTQADCYEPYLIVIQSDMPECPDTAFITPCINVVDNSGINDNYSNNLDFSIFPNPAKESFSVLCDDKESIKISVFDMNGKIIINIPNYQGAEIDIKNLISGIYFVKIQSSQTTVCKKLFVE